MSRWVFRLACAGLERRDLPTASAMSVAVLAVKRPAFSDDYLGPHRQALNLRGADATLIPGRWLTLSATVAARIVARPTGPENSSFFVFGLDRRAPQTPAWFPHRPRLRFDSVVVVRVSPEGPSVFAQNLLTSEGPIELDPSSIRIRGRTVRVTIPAGVPTPPEGAGPARQTRFAVWMRSKFEHTLADLSDYVASFLPEDGTLRVRVVKGP